MANNITLSYPSAFHHQFLDLNGKPLTGGKLYTYIAGSTTPVVTYKTISGGTESANRNTNPIILDMAGMAELVIATDTAYKFVLFDKNDAKIAEWDNVTGNIGGGGGSSEDIVVVGTPNEIDVSSSVTQGVKRYVISLSNSVKSTILYLVGLYNNVLNSLGNKADKVQGATTGNLAALDAEGNLTDSGSKISDFKTKQTAVPDPSASGAGLDFIDSVMQDANGEITPHKKSVQDGTTAQKGVVKLSNAIDSTSVTEAATPKAVKDAYDALNNKIVARATFLSQAEWAVQSQLPGDPAKVYYVENGTGEDAYTVYVWKESTSTYEEVDESSIDLDGYWHDEPTTTGSGNVVTNITLGNDGVPQVEKGMSAEPAFSVLPINKGGTGKDNEKAALNKLTSQMTHYDTQPTDETLLVQKFGTPTDGNGALYTRPYSYLWEYIKSKISSVLGLSENGYTGNAATASAAASGSALETAINAKMDKNGYVDYKEGFWVGTKWPIDTNYDSCFWKVCSFSVSNYWSLSFELVATNLYFDSVGQETKVITIYSSSTNSVNEALECRTKYVKNDSRGYGNIMYYTIDNGVVTVYVKTAKKANATQFLRLVSVTNRSSITNLTWYCEEAPGEQPSNPTKFTERIVNVTPSVGSQTIPVYSDAYGKMQQCDPSQMSVGTATTATNYASGGGIETALAGKLGTSGDGSNVTSTFTKASGDTSTMASGGKLSAIFTAISSFFASVASALNGKQDSLGISSSGDTGKFLNERGSFTTPNYPSVPSVINNLTSDSTTDALSAAQGKALNEKFPTFGFASFNGTDVGYKAVGYIEPPTEQYGNVYLEALVTYSLGGAGIVSSMELVKFNIRRDDTTYSNRFERKLIFGYYQGNLRFKAYYSNVTHKIWLYAHKSVNDNTYCGISISVLNVHGWEGSAKTNAYKLGSYNIENDPGIPELVAASATISTFSAGQVGSTLQPVYVDSNGQVQECVPAQMSVGNATKWDGHAISIGTVSSSAGTISIV